MTNETNNGDPLQQALNEAEQLMSDLNAVSGDEEDTNFSEELLSKEVIGGFSIDDDDDDGVVETIDLMHPLHDNFLKEPTAEAISSSSPQISSNVGATNQTVVADASSVAGSNSSSIPVGPTTPMYASNPLTASSSVSSPSSVPAPLIGAGGGPPALADAFKSSTSKFASNLAHLAQRAATQVAAQGAAAAAATLNATAVAPPSSFSGSSSSGAFLGTPGATPSSSMTSNSFVTATPPIVPVSWDNEQKQALLEQHVGSLLPGERVIMFLTNLLHVEYHSNYCLSASSTFDTNASTTGAGQPLWCCVMTYYRLILFATATATTNGTATSASTVGTSSNPAAADDGGAVAPAPQPSWREGWNSACLPPTPDPKSAWIEIPLACIDKVDKSVYSSNVVSTNMATSSQVGLRIHSKLGESVRFSTLSYDDTKKAQEALHTYAFPGRRQLGFLFAFESKRQAVLDSIQTLDNGQRVVTLPPLPRRFVPLDEFERQFGGNPAWTVSQNVNAQYQVCGSYPSVVVGPSTIQMDTPPGLALVKECAGFRSEERWPCLTWAKKTSGASLWRASQPRVGLQGNRCGADEYYLRQILDCATAANQRCPTKPPSLSWSMLQLLTGSQDLTQWVRPPALLQPVMTLDGGQPQLQEQHVLKILDLRPRSSAMANRTGGFGYENTSHYPGTTLQFCGIGNIHAVRDSYQKLIALATSPRTVDLSWHAAVEDTKWLSHVRLILTASWEAAFWIHVHQLPVLLHCSHGWDRTAQVAALAELMLDPYYRTRKGFAVVVEKDFMAFGHPFHTRCSHGEGKGMTDSTSGGGGGNASSFDDGQVSPIFLQFLDCVYQIVSMYPECFEFNTKYLLVLSEHIYSCRFGDFLCDTERERETAANIRQRTHCMWDYLDSRDDLTNENFNVKEGGHGTLLMPLPTLLRHVHLWSDRHCRYAPKPTVRWLPAGMTYRDGHYPTVQELHQMLLTNPSIPLPVIHGQSDAEIESAETAEASD